MRTAAATHAASAARPHRLGSIHGSAGSRGPAPVCVLWGDEGAVCTRDTAAPRTGHSLCQPVKRESERCREAWR